ncbi:hypothetical protein [Streptomyces sp. NPDC002088]|uniref:hypothetical protein n=1 Tax=Streptomyces sp. NPDC002088 TaxID=3154665 RepID=UPI0033241C7C
MPVFPSELPQAGDSEVTPSPEPTAPETVEELLAPTDQERAPEPDLEQPGASAR